MHLNAARRTDAFISTVCMSRSGCSRSSKTPAVKRTIRFSQTNAWAVESGCVVFDNAISSRTLAWIARAGAPFCSSLRMLPSTCARDPNSARRRPFSARRTPAEYPARGRGGAATRRRGISSSPPRRAPASLRTIQVAAGPTRRGEDRALDDFLQRWHRWRRRLQGRRDRQDDAARPARVFHGRGVDRAPEGLEGRHHRRDAVEERPPVDGPSRGPASRFFQQRAGRAERFNRSRGRRPPRPAAPRLDDRRRARERRLGPVRGAERREPANDSSPRTSQPAAAAAPRLREISRSSRGGAPRLVSAEDPRP